MERRSVWRVYFLFFIFGFSIILLGLGVSYFEQRSAVEKDFINDSKKTLALHEILIKNRIFHYQSELETLAQSPFVLALAQERQNFSKKEEEVNTAYFLDLAKSHDEMMQVRYINNDGDEVLRIDRADIEDVPKPVPSPKLQNKKDRYYYKQLSAVAQGVVWYSQIDLNIEHKKIQVPYKPTLRIGTPVFVNRERQGMIVINIFVKPLFEKLKGSKNYQLYLCDDKGNFLLHPDPKYNWTKYRNIDYTLFDEFPRIASKIIRHSSFLHKDIFAKELDFGQSEKYYLIAQLNEKLIDKEKRDLIKSSLLMGVFVMFITFPFGLIIIRQIEHLSSRLFAIIDGLGDGIFIIDKEERATYVNNKTIELSGYSVDELLHEKPHQLLQHGDAEGKHIDSDNCPIHNVNRTQQQYHADNSTFVTKSGKVINVEYTTTPFFINDKYEGSITLFKDVTKRKLVEKELMKLSKVIEQIDDIVTITDPRGYITYVNKAFCKFTGYSEEEALGSSPRLYQSDKHSAREIEALWDTILQGRVYRGVIINKKKNGEHYYEEKTITPLMDEDGNITSFVSTGKDITERVEMGIKLEELASTDYLTGLKNRFKFEEIFNQELIRSRRYNTPLSLIMFDIDYFKKINDTFGHDIGDSVLKEISHLVEVHVRQSDVVARWGGEEFMILTPEVDLESVFALAEKLREAINGFKFFKIGHLTCSFGVSQLHQDENFTSLCQRVDTAMYQAKESGRNRTVKA